MANESDANLYLGLAMAALDMIDGKPHSVRVMALAECFMRITDGFVRSVPLALHQAIGEALGPELAPPGALKSYLDALVDVVKAAECVVHPLTTADYDAGGKVVLSTDRLREIEGLRAALARVSLAKGTNVGPAEARPEAG